jgi:hypothetical protein
MAFMNFTHSDVELGHPVQVDGLYNATVKAYRWVDINAVIPAKSSVEGKILLAGVSGEARAGR